MPTALEMIEKYYEDRDAPLNTKRKHIANAKKFGSMDIDNLKFSKVRSMIEDMKNESAGGNSRGKPLGASAKEGIVSLLIILLDRNVAKKQPDVLKKLREYRSELKEDIEAERDQKRGDQKAKIGTDQEGALPTYDELLKSLDSKTGASYVTMYNILKLGFRNSDNNMSPINAKKNINSKIKDTDRNWFYIDKKNNKVTLYINNYKTFNKYGTKIIEIDDPDYVRNLQQAFRGDQEYLYESRDGKPVSQSYLGDIVFKATDGLGETAVMKVIMHHLISEKKFKEIKQLSKTRGSAYARLLEDYNIFMSEDQPEEEESD